MEPSRKHSHDSPPASCPSASEKSPEPTEKRRKKRKITHVISKKTEKELDAWEKELDAWEKELDAWEREDAGDPLQIDGFPIDEIDKIEQSDRLKEQAIKLFEELYSLSKGEGLEAQYAHGCTIELAKTLLNRHNDLACDEPQTAQGKASSVLMAETAHGIVSRSPFVIRRRKPSKTPSPLELNSAFMLKMTRRLPAKDFERRADQSKLMQKAIAHFDAVRADVVYARANGAKLSKKQQRVVKFEWFFDPSKPVSQEGKIAVFEALFFPWARKPSKQESRDDKELRDLRARLVLRAEGRRKSFPKDPLKAKWDALKGDLKKAFSAIVEQKNLAILEYQNKGEPARLQ